MKQTEQTPAQVKTDVETRQEGLGGTAPSGSHFLKGTLILTLSSIVVKVIGAVNWILLSRVLGGEGIGLYQMGFPIYLMAITVSSAGIPVAISIVTAEKVAREDYGGAQRVFHVTLRLLFVTGLLFSSILFSAPAGLSTTISSSATRGRTIPLSPWRRRSSLSRSWPASADTCRAGSTWCPRRAPK